MASDITEFQLWEHIRQIVDTQTLICNNINEMTKLIDELCKRLVDLEQRAKAFNTVRSAVSNQSGCCSFSDKLGTVGNGLMSIEDQTLQNTHKGGTDETV